MNASPGAAVGKAVFDSDRAEELADKGEQVILVRRETNPDDLNGMIAAQGILTSRGGKTSHAAVVARGMGKTCVCGAEELEVDLKGRTFTARGGAVVNEGDVISIDGTSGAVYLGEVPVQPSPVVQYFEGELDPEPTPSADELVQAVHRLMAHADEARRLEVRANADTPEDAERARRFGAAGHRPVPHRAHVPRRAAPATSSDLILAETDEERQAALDALEPLQREDFVGIFTAMDGLPVTVRLLDPPLHEFLPDLTELSVEVAARPRQRARTPSDASGRCSTRCAGCTSRTRCSACAACGSAWSSPACSPCRCGRSPRPRRSCKADGGTRRPRSWCRSSAPCRSSR